MLDWITRLLSTGTSTVLDDLVARPNGNNSTKSLYLSCPVGGPSAVAGISSTREKQSDSKRAQRFFLPRNSTNAPHACRWGSLGAEDQPRDFAIASRSRVHHIGAESRSAADQQALRSGGKQFCCRFISALSVDHAAHSIDTFPMDRKWTVAFPRISHRLATGRVFRFWGSRYRGGVWVLEAAAKDWHS